MASFDKIPIIFCIDVEPDERKIEPNSKSDWIGFESTFEYFQSLRPRLAQATKRPVHFSWFIRLDPQVAHIYGSPDWPLKRYAFLLKQLEIEGDEIGLHSHAWRWDTNTNDWLADLANPGWVDHCVVTAFDAYEKHFRHPCRSFRFGDHWMSERLLDRLEERGVEFDLTLEPGQAHAFFLPDENFAGSFPNCLRVCQEPYRPHPDNFTKVGGFRKRKLWLIPVSAEFPRQANRKHRHRNPLYSAAGQNDIYHTLNLAFSREVFSTVGDRLLSRLPRPFLVSVARSDVATQAKENLEENLEYILSHPLITRFSCETPSEAISSFQKEPWRWLANARARRMHG